MNIFDRVKEGNLPIKQEKVIESILDDLETSSFLTGHEICQNYSISFSSLTRMAKALNYSGFPELKKEIEKLYKDEFSPSSKAKSFLLNSKKDSIEALVLKSEISSIEKISQVNLSKEFNLLAKKINQSERVFILGISQLEPICQKLSNSLEILGKKTICFTELGFSKKSELFSINKNDMLISFSVNKELLELGDFLKALNKRKVTTALVTDKRTGQLRKYAGLSIYVDSTGTGSLNSLTPYITVTNIIESILFSLDKHKHLSKIKKIEESWNSLPIFY